MLPVLHGDAVTAARALLAAPECERAGLIAQLLIRADQADIYRRRRRKLHPFWGDGSLEGAARKVPLCREPFLDQPDYCACLIAVFEAILRFRAGPARGRS